MSNLIEISPKLFGLKINDNGTRYNFSTTPFTQSSRLVDETGNVVAELKRFGWFRLNFNLIVDGNNYLLKCRTLNNELTTPQGEIYETGLTVNFYSQLGQATQLKHNNRYKKYVSLEVYSELDRIALIISSCLFTVRYLHAGIS